MDAGGTAAMSELRVEIDADAQSQAEAQTIDLQLPGSSSASINTQSEDVPTPDSFARRENAPPTEEFTAWRLVGFLMLHLLTFGAEVAAMVTFFITRDWWFLCAILLTFLFSGIFCAHAAWECPVQSLNFRCLPLKRLKRPLGIFLAIPLGLGQGVIILLAFDDYYTRISPEQRDANRQTPANKFHLKAVNGIFEGCMSSAVILYAYWSMNFPDADRAITKDVFPWEGVLLAVLGTTAFFQSGIGVLELDFCVSKTISKRMRKSIRYEMMHWLFRVSEVISRVGIFTGFMVLMHSQAPNWWWFPLAADFVVTIMLVAIYGGAEKTWLVRILCGLPCVFTNVFMFIDSPYKRRAASRLSRCLHIRSATEQIVLPAIFLINGVYRYGTDNMQADLLEFWKSHWPTNITVLVSIPLYWFLVWWITSTTIHKNNIVDIFSACEKGSVSTVKRVMRDLTKSAAIGLNINCFDIEGKTPLMFAALGGHDKVCKLLLQEGARVDLCMFRKATFSWRTCFFLSIRRRWTALHMAAWKGHPEVIRILVEGGSSVVEASQDEDMFMDAFQETPLHVATWSGHEEAVRLLVVKHPQWLDKQNAQGQTPLDLARSESMRQAILSPTAGGEDGGRAALLLQLTQRDATRNRDAVDSWPQVQLAIARSSNDLTAPGLCSYITSSCGGALGKAFLMTMPNSTEPGIPRLPTVSDVDDNYSSTIIMEDGSSPPLPSVSLSIHSNSATPSVYAAPSTPQMEDLEPISSTGESVSPECLRRRESLQSFPEEGQTCGSRCWRRRPTSSQSSITLDDPFQSERFRYVPEKSLLGQGAYGIVWRAMDRRTRTWYAVKNIKTFRRGAGDIARRECEVADRIRFQPHPCLVHLFHVHHFADAALYCLVMEFCPGGDLLGTIRGIRHQCLRERHSYVAPPQARQWLGQVFLGLEHMHLRMDTLLRDLKPENCVLTSSGRVKLTDFGFGRFGVESCGRWSFGIPTGSPGYVAPEILRKLEYDSRVDLYSLGVLVWVLLTGGVTSNPEPAPPLGRMRRAMDFDAHLQDWLLLAQCITSPAEYDALPMPEDARDFVARLTHQRPDNRLRHREIRLHAFMQSLPLPNFDAAPKEVEAWLQTTSNPAVAA